jgi:cysteine desulfurase
MKQLYLDANAHMPISNAAINAFVNFNSSRGGYGNAMSVSSPGIDASSAIEESRFQIAKNLGVDSRQIFFAANCTQACEWGAHILNKRHKGGQVYISQIEHPSVKFSVREKIKDVKSLFVNNNGIVSKSIEFSPKDSLVCTHVQNEIGTIQPIEYWFPGLFMCDISQSVGKLPINLSNMNNIHIAIAGAHKFGGPVGVGILYLQDPNLWDGIGYGNRYYSDRTGTPDAASIVAAAVALKESIGTLRNRYSKMVEFRSVLESGLSDMGWKIIGSEVARIPNTTFVKVPKRMGRNLLSQLNSEGIYIGLGSACNSNQKKSSPLMNALGYGGNVDDYIRISQFGNYGTTEAKYLLAKLKRYAPSTTGDTP